MNELDVLRAVSNESSLPELTELSAARDRLLRAISKEQETGARRLGRVPARRSALVVGGALAAACLAVAAVLGAFANGRSVVVVSPPVEGHPTAAQVLGRAAFVALQTTPLAPRPDQFVYTRVEASGGRVRQAWLSVDGARTSLAYGHAIAGCVHGQACQVARAYFPAMPTEPARMLRYLQRTQGVRLSNLNDLAKTVGAMLDSDYLLPAQQAALYRFLARVPGITVHHGVRDAAGRQGVGVAWSFDRSRAMLIFDPATYQYLGTTTEGVAGQVSGDALLQLAIVDRAGQVPGTAHSPTA